MTVDYALHRVSYANLILYMSTLPSYSDLKAGKEDKDKKPEKTINASDPSNQDEVAKILFG